VGARSTDGSRMIIDLAALAQQRDAGHVIALLDAELARATGVGTPPPQHPADRFAPLGRAELARMAGSLIEPVHNSRVDHATAVHTHEPPTTGPPAADHSDATPPRGAVPDRTADRPGSTRDQATGTGERRPANPYERRDDLRSRYRCVLDRTLALPTSP